MKQIIHISGMTCTSCLAAVSKSLNAIEEIRDLQIDLESGNVQLEVSKLLNLDRVAKALPSKYKPSAVSGGKNLDDQSETSKIKQLFPLFLIFIYIIAGSLFLQKGNFSVTDFMFDFMGCFFIVFSFFKFLDYKGFPTAFAQYDPIARRALLYGKIYPFIETFLGIMFLTRWQLNLALIITIIVISLTTVGVIYALFDKNKINCACLGTALKLPMSEATLIENILMLFMSITMIFYQLA